MVMSSGVQEERGETDKENSKMDMTSGVQAERNDSEAGISLPPFRVNPSRGWPATPGLKRWALVAPETPFLEKPSDEAAILSVLKTGDEVDFVAVETVRGKKWCKVVLSNGQKGYMRGDTQVRQLLYVQLEQARGEMLYAPEATAPVARQLVRGINFLILETVKPAAEAWVRIRLSDGQEGFLHGKAKIKRLDTPATAKAANSPEHDMLVGALWCIGGILVTACTYSAAAEKGGSYTIAWGAILFGGIQFFKGLINSSAEPSSPSTPTYIDSSQPSNALISPSDSSQALTWHCGCGETNIRSADVCRVCQKMRPWNAD